MVNSFACLPSFSASIATSRPIFREFVEFVQDSTLIFHNAPFDLGFINHEIQSAGLPGITDLPVIDTLIG